MSDNEFSAERPSAQIFNHASNDPNFNSYQPQPSQIIFEEFSHLVKDMKSVMKNFKIFFDKYLAPNENHFNQRQGKILAYHPQQKQYQPNQQQKQQQQKQQQTYSYQDLSTNQQNIYQSNVQQFMPLNNKFSSYHDHPTEYNNLSQSIAYKPSSKLTLGQKLKKYNIQKKKKTQQSDPNKPKSPLTPYFLFFQQNRDIFRKKYPEMSLSQIGSLGGKIWRQLSQEERHSYKDRYQEAKVKYKADMKYYNSGANYPTGFNSKNQGSNYKYTEIQEIQDIF